jgi:predicted negative regulator of RcsB-dependent stress response
MHEGSPMTQSTSSNPSPLIDALNSTEFGSFIARHLNIVVTLLVLVVVGIFGYGIFRYQQERKFEAHAQTLFQFESTELKALSNNEASVTEFMSKLRGIQDEVGSYVGLTPLVLQASDELSNRGQWDEALEALKMVSQHKRNPYIHIFIAHREARAYEDLGKYREAIGVLEGLRSNSVKLLEDKLYLDLGRLYKRVGDTEKARLSFEYILKLPMAQEEFATMARLFLSEL